MPSNLSTYTEEIQPSAGGRIRYAWFAIWALLVTIPTSILQLVSHQFNPTAANFKRWSGLWGRLILRGCGIRVRLLEARPLDRKRPYIFVSNHQNALDILALAAALPYPFGFLAKAELERVPFLGFAIRNSASVLIDRSDPRSSLRSMKEAGDRIRRGNSVLVFAEGARSYAASMGPFKKGAFLLAVEAGVPLVPVAVVDAYRLLDERRHVMESGTMHIRVGEPLPLGGTTRRDVPKIMEEIRVRVEKLLTDRLPEAQNL